jgi:hypothetical protein
VRSGWRGVEGGGADDVCEEDCGRSMEGVLS